MRDLPVAEPQLSVGVVAEGKEMSFLREGEGVVGPGGDADDDGLEGFEDSRGRFELLVVYSSSALSTVVFAPAEDLALVGDDQIVISSGSGADDALRFQGGNLLRNSLRLLVAQLAELVGAASVDAPVIEEEEGVVEAASSRDQLLRSVVEELQR